MERRANVILSGNDNIKVRSEIEPVFEFAQRCAAVGETNKALTYLNRALEHKPWNLSAQLTLAQLLDAQGNREGARNKAELVWKYGETDFLLAGAAKILGKSFDSTLTNETLAAPNGVILVPIGKVDAWLIRDVRDGIREVLGMPVAIQLADVTIPEPDRNPLQKWAEELRQRLRQSANQPAVQAQMKLLSIDSGSWKTDDGVFESIEALLATDPNMEQVKQFRENLRNLRALGPQWDASKLLQQAPQITRAGETNKVVMAFTHHDLFSDQSRFVFGISLIGDSRGIFSYRRFTAGTFDTAPNRAKLRERAVKQALSSIGIALGFQRCTDPTCSRAYAHSLDEHDAKELKLCDECRSKFATRFKK